MSERDMSKKDSGPFIVETTNTERQTSTGADSEADIYHWLQRGSKLPQLSAKKLRKQQRWIAKNPQYLGALMADAEPYLSYITQQIDARGLPSELALLPAIESAYKSYATSKSGAAGIWQFVPQTAHEYNLKQDHWYDARRDFVASTDAALTYLQKLNSQFGGDWLLTIAAYNAGPGTIERAMAVARRRGKHTDFNALDIRAETKRYVPKLIALRDVLLRPDKFGLTLPKIDLEKGYHILRVEQAIDLKDMAIHLEADVDRFLAVNGAHIHGVIPDGRAAIIWVPQSKLDHAKVYLDQQHSRRTDFAMHQVIAKETLIQISKRYQTDIQDIRRLNRLSDDHLNIGQVLIVPKIIDNDNAKLHAVTPGDTLWSIAKHYQINVQQLLHWNQISEDTILSLGQQLIVAP